MTYIPYSSSTLLDTYQALILISDYIPSVGNASTTIIETTFNNTTAFGSEQEASSLLQLTAVPYILSAIAAILLLFFLAIYSKDRIKRSMNRLGQRLCQQHLKYGIQEENKKTEVQDLLGIHTQQDRLPSKPTGSP
ncbi:hypothetical protein DPMN_072740 [Dreissena polymorpha]|uniref:Uncharacterized protein n=1 Tax=Dreissena polymorpha TaxID=45954 RepID=A0A9D4HC55_DREPO|nr:hypothetical protein DPMN_072740 [Dreissena polymorpha]